MHALTCDILDINSYGYAMIPTYYQPNRFIAAQVYVEYAWHYEQSIYYHITISDLLGDEFDTAKILSTAQVRCINRYTRKIGLQFIPVIRTLSKQTMLSEIQKWHKDYVIDLPAPFAAKNIDGLLRIQQEIQDYFDMLAKTFTICHLQKTID